MIAKAQLRYIRITPRKFRQIIPLVMGQSPEDAIAVLMSVKKKASLIAIDLLRSAIANAGRIQGVDVGNLYVSKLVASGGPQLKRFRAGSMGRAGQIRKRTSHILVELDDVVSRPSNKTSHAVSKTVKVEKSEKIEKTETVKEKAKEKITKKKPATAKK